MSLFYSSMGSGGDDWCTGDRRAARAAENRRRAHPIHAANAERIQREREALPLRPRTLPPDTAPDPLCVVSTPKGVACAARH
jgi:hypothetical protein